MSFAAKIAKDQTISLSSLQPTSLTITNVALDPNSKMATLYLKSDNDEDQILVTILSHQKNQSYQCSIKLSLEKNKSRSLKSCEGEIHVIGHYEEEKVNPQKKKDKQNKIIVKRSSQKAQVQEKIIPQRQKRRSVNLSKTNEKVGQKLKQNKTKDKKRASQTNKKGKKENPSLLDMINDIDSSQSDSDEQFEANQSEQSSSSDSEQESSSQTPKINQRTTVQRKDNKKVSWASMLKDVSDDEDEKDDQQYSQESQSSESESSFEDDDEEPPPKKKKKVQSSKQQHSKIKQKKSQKTEFQQEADKRVSEKLKPPVQLPLDNSEDSSSSFIFETPKELPSFVKKKLI